MYFIFKKTQICLSRFPLSYFYKPGWLHGIERNMLLLNIFRHIHIILGTIPTIADNYKREISSRLISRFLVFLHLLFFVCLTSLFFLFFTHPLYVIVLLGCYFLFSLFCKYISTRKQQIGRWVATRYTLLL